MAVETILKSNVFSLKTKEFYKASLNRKNRRAYERSMRHILRWQDEPIKHLVEGLHEYDMDHIFALGSIAQDIATYNPHLSAEINFPAMQRMIIVHDAAEIITGDVPAVGVYRDSREGRRKKRAESLITRLMVNKYVRKEQRQAVLEAYYRYENVKHVLQSDQPVTDKEALLTNFIDKVHSISRTGVEYVYNSKRHGQLITPELRQRHMGALDKMMSYVPPLLGLLSPEAAVEFRGVVRGELMRLVENGFATEIEASYGEYLLPTVTLAQTDKVALG